MPFQRLSLAPCGTQSVAKGASSVSVQRGDQDVVEALNLKPLSTVSRDWAAIAAAAVLAVVACYGAYALVWLLVHRSSVVSVMLLVGALVTVAVLR